MNYPLQKANIHAVIQNPLVVGRGHLLGLGKVKKKFKDLPRPGQFIHCDIPHKRIPGVASKNSNKVEEEMIPAVSYTHLTLPTIRLV